MAEAGGAAVGAEGNNPMLSLILYLAHSDEFEQEMFLPNTTDENKTINAVRRRQLAACQQARETVDANNEVFNNFVSTKREDFEALHLVPPTEMKRQSKEKSDQAKFQNAWSIAKDLTDTHRVTVAVGSANKTKASAALLRSVATAMFTKKPEDLDAVFTAAGQACSADDVVAPTRIDILRGLLGNDGILDAIDDDTFERVDGLVLTNAGLQREIREAGTGQGKPRGGPVVDGDAPVPAARAPVPAARAPVRAVPDLPPSPEPVRAPDIDVDALPDADGMVDAPNSPNLLGRPPLPASPDVDAQRLDAQRLADIAEQRRRADAEEAARLRADAALVARNKGAALDEEIRQQAALEQIRQQAALEQIRGADVDDEGVARAKKRGRLGGDDDRKEGDGKVDEELNILEDAAQYAGDLSADPLTPDETQMFKEARTRWNTGLRTQVGAENPRLSAVAQALQNVNVLTPAGDIKQASVRGMFPFHQRYVIELFQKGFFVVDNPDAINPLEGGGVGGGVGGDEGFEDAANALGGGGGGGGGADAANPLGGGGGEGFADAVNPLGAGRENFDEDELKDVRDAATFKQNLGSAKKAWNRMKDSEVVREYLPEFKGYLTKTRTISNTNINSETAEALEKQKRLVELYLGNKFIVSDAARRGGRQFALRAAAFQRSRIASVLASMRTSSLVSTY